jgi:hypothetical protein
MRFKVNVHKLYNRGLWSSRLTQISTRILRASFCADHHKNNTKMEGQYDS